MSSKLPNARLGHRSSWVILSIQPSFLVGRQAHRIKNQNSKIREAPKFPVDWQEVVVFFEVKDLCRFFLRSKICREIVPIFWGGGWYVGEIENLSKTHQTKNFIEPLWWFSFKGRDSHELPPKTCLSCISFVGGLSSNHQDWHLVSFAQTWTGVNFIASFSGSRAN